jgi:hypothetical protein
MHESQPNDLSLFEVRLLTSRVECVPEGANVARGQPDSLLFMKGVVQCRRGCLLLDRCPCSTRILEFERALLPLRRLV